MAKPLSEYKVSTLLAADNNIEFRWLGVFPERSSDYTLQMHVWCVERISGHTQSFSYPELAVAHPQLLRSLKQCMSSMSALTKWRQGLSDKHVPCGFRLLANDAGDFVGLRGTYNTDVEIGGKFQGRIGVTYTTFNVRNLVTTMAILAQFADFELRMIDLIEDRIRFNSVNFKSIKKDAALTLSPDMKTELARFETCLRLETFAVQTAQHETLKGVATQFQISVERTRVDYIMREKPTTTTVKRKRAPESKVVTVPVQYAVKRAHVRLGRRGRGRPPRVEVPEPTHVAVPSQEHIATPSIIPMHEATAAVTIEAAYVDSVFGDVALTLVRQPATPFT